MLLPLSTNESPNTKKARPASAWELRAPNANTRPRTSHERAAIEPDRDEKAARLEVKVLEWGGKWRGVERMLYRKEDEDGSCLISLHSDLINGCFFPSVFFSTFHCQLKKGIAL